MNERSCALKVFQLIAPSILSVCLLLWPASLYSEERTADLKEIRLSSDTWHMLTTPDGKGLYFNLIRAVYEPLGIRVSPVIVPYTRSVALVEKKMVDGWVASFMNEQPFPLYPKWHFDRNRQVVVSLKGGKSRFAGVESLRGKKVVWLRNFNLNKYITVPLNFQEIDDIAGAFAMLASGHADFFIGAESDIMSAIKDNKIDASKYAIDFLMHLKLYIAFADTDRGRRFRDIWDKRMDKLSKDPAFLKIYKRYHYPIPFD